MPLTVTEKDVVRDSEKVPEAVPQGEKENDGVEEAHADAATE